MIRERHNGTQCCGLYKGFKVYFELIPRIQMWCLISYIFIYKYIFIFFTKGVAFFKKLTNVAWYLDPHIPKFIERRLKMPKIIMGLYDDVDKMELATSPQSFIG